jgi:hypothetical protein
MVAESTMPTIYVCCARISGKMVHQLLLLLLLLLYLLAYALLEAACAAGASVVNFCCTVCLLPVFITLQHNSPHHVHQIYVYIFLCSFFLPLSRSVFFSDRLAAEGSSGMEVLVGTPLRMPAQTDFKSFTKLIAQVRYYVASSISIVTCAFFSSSFF